jgi:hypothetical protein
MKAVSFSSNPPIMLSTILCTSYPGILDMITPSSSPINLSNLVLQTYNSIPYTSSSTSVMLLTKPSPSTNPTETILSSH